MLNREKDWLLYKKKMQIFLLSAFSVSFPVQTTYYKNSLSTQNTGKINDYLPSSKIQQHFMTSQIG